MLSRKDVDRIAPYAKRTAQKLHVIALVLHLDELADEILAFLRVSRAQNQSHLCVAFGLADAVDGRDRRHDHRIATFENGFGGCKPHLFDMLIDGRILFNEKIARRHISFGLIVVVVGNKVFDSVVREELTHFTVELRRKRLVGRHHDGWYSQARNDVSHRKGLARPGNAQKRLRAVALPKAFGKFGNRRRLITGRIELRVQFKRRMLKSQNLSHKYNSQQTQKERIRLISNAQNKPHAA